MNILYYFPIGSIKRIDMNLLYGIDIINELIERHPEWNFIKADGSVPRETLYGNIDILLRPTRHDGYSRMIVEAQLKRIPVIWSYLSGEYIEPKIEDIEKQLENIAKDLEGKTTI